MHKQSIISWNINSVLAKFAFLHKLLHDLDPIILCLQETKLSPMKNLSLKNFTVYRRDCLSEGNAKGGVLIAVQTTIHSQPLNLTTELQAIAVRVHLQTPVTICNIYLHQADDITLSNLEQLTQQLPKPFILTGDFNAHNSTWGSTQTDQRGQIIETFLNSSDMLLLNDGSPTRFNLYNGSSSAIDLTFCSSNLFPQLHWKVCSSLYSSDYHPLIVELLSSQPTHRTLPQKWHFKDANWDLYRQTLDFSAVYSSQSVDITLDHIVQNIISAATIAIPHTQTTLLNGHFRHRVPWWNKKCSTLIKEKHKLFNRCRRYPTNENLTLFKIARAKVRREVIRSKKESWRNFISTICSKTPASILWNKLRAINNKRAYVPIPAILNRNNQLQTTEETIAETFADHYYKVTQADPSLPLNWDLCTGNVDESLPDEINTPITLSELKVSFRSLKNTSPGPDGIHASMLKNLNHQHCEAITFFFNRIWQEHNFPTAWREAYVLPIHKPDKNLTDPASYRAISLTNILCKALEKIIVKRLHCYLEKKNCLDQYQCGFRPARSTLDNLLYLQEEIHLGYNRKQHVSCIFFDVEKAFDRLLPTTVLQAMQNIGMAGNILHFVHNFLRQRFFSVRIGQTLSTPRLQETGTPQGSVISPVLFILALNSISEALPRNIQHLFYADDLVIFLRHNNQAEANKKLQTTVDRLSEWGAEKGLAFSPSKTKVLNFTRKRHQINLQLTLYNKPLVQVTETTFLGMNFDSKLRWTSHIRQLKNKCIKRLSILKVLNGSSWGSDRKCLLRLYICYIRSIMDYGNIMYATASQSTLNQLNAIQNSALRIATGALRSSPVTSLHVETNITPLQHHRNTATLIYYFKVHSIPRHINAFRLTSDANSFSNFRNHCQRLLQQYGLQILDGQQHITKTDLLPAVLAAWQQDWTESPPTSLKLLKPTLAEWSTSYQENRKNEKILARIRIGHTILTHSFFYKKLPPPICEPCGIRLDVPHILNHCIQFHHLRLHTYHASPFPVLETLLDCPKEIDRFFNFVMKCNIRHQL